MQNTSELKASEVKLTDRVVEGRMYWQASARGWSTGPCSSASAAMQRLTSYFAGEEITSAPDGIASREEMAAAAELLSGRCRIRGMAYPLEPGEFLSDAWVRASQQIGDMRLYREPEFVAATECSPRIRIGGAS